MDDPRETFLKAEEQAQKLASQLSALKEKMEGHAEAEQSLSDTKNSLQELISELVVGTAHLQKVIEKLSEIGTPEILEQLSAISEDQSKFHEVMGRKTTKNRLFFSIILGLNILVITLQVVSLILK